MADLPVVAWREKDFEDFAVEFGAEFAIRSCGTTYADAQTHAMWCMWQTGRAPAQAALEQARAEVERLTKALTNLQIRYEAMFDLYVRPTYHASSDPQSDLDLALSESRAALKSPTPGKEQT